jgi:hypothetical protein
MSFNDPIFAGVTNGSVGQVLANGVSLTDKSFANANNGNQIITLNGNNTLTRVRVGLPTREGPRVAGNGTFTFNSCWIEVDGTGADHADCIQTYAPGSSGSLVLNNTTLRAYKSGERGGIGSAGIMGGENWVGSFVFRNVLFWSGYVAAHLYPDVGGDIHFNWENVYFVNSSPSYGPYGGHKVVVDRWVNVCNATIVNGVVVPGAPLARP